MPVVKKMPMQHFNNVVRWIKRCSLDKVGFFNVVCENTMQRLGLETDLSKAVKGVPDGSDSVDFMSIKVWMDDVNVEHKHAVAQIVAFDATVNQRMGQ